MKAILVIEHRFKKDSRGNIYSTSSSVNTILWERYLKVFDKLTVFARIKDVEEEIDKRYLVSYNRVSFQSIPYYVGPKEFLYNYFKIEKFIKNNIEEDQAYICRLPSITGNMVIKQLNKRKIPYIVELVGDPWEVYSNGVLKNSLFLFLNLFHKYRSFLTLKTNVKHAKGVIYVTETTLQKRYPPGKNAITTHASNVILKKEFIRPKPKQIESLPKPFNLLSIGSLEQLYKSPDIVLKAVNSLIISGVEIKLVWLGDGFYKESMIEMAKKLGIEDYVNFKGNISSEEVAKELENSHLYLHVSRTEGLPRALIEAMGKGLPCIGTTVGGIPELLDNMVLIGKNNVEELVLKINYLIDNIDILNTQAATNLKKAGTFEFNTLAERRNEIYNSMIG